MRQTISPSDPVKRMNAVDRRPDPTGIYTARIACLERDRDRANERAVNLASLLAAERERADRLQRVLIDHTRRCPLNRAAVAVLKEEEPKL